MHLIQPKTIEQREGRFDLTKAPRIGVTRRDDLLPARALITTAGFAGAHLRVATDGEIVLRRDRSIVHPEGYELEIGHDRITVSASTSAGCYYGVQTLRELIRTHGSDIPCTRIVDEPTLKRRGYYLDCSRGKVPTVETVKEVIERLGEWKINELQLYVENVFTFAAHPSIGKGYSPFTPEDILEIGTHCRLHHIDFVPSLTSLGHFEKILMLDEYSELGELPGFRDLPGGTTICPENPRSIELIADLYGEYLPLFDSEEFNACGDEPWELGQGGSKERAESEGVGTVYLDFILELRKLSLRHGKRMNLWGDIVLKHPEIIPRLPADMTMLNWDYTADGHMMVRTGEFATADLSLVCCPGTNGWQSHGTRIGQGFDDILRFAEVGVQNGAEGLLNTDWGDAGHRNSLGVSMHGTAYGGACSWNPAAELERSREAFLEAFVFHTYGDRTKRLVPVLETIGDDFYDKWAYHALIEKLGEPVGFGEGFCRAHPAVGNVEHTDEAIESKRSISRALQVPAAETFELPREEPSFEQISLDECALAARMNAAACERVLLARAIRDGKRPDRDRLEHHAVELEGIRDDLEKVWLMRNRYSRLKDNLAGFDCAIEDTRSYR